MQQIAEDIEECARVHGAGWWQTLGRILIALAWPAFAVGWVLIFFGIMRELSASILLYVPGTEVLSVVMLKMWVSGKPEEVSVIGLVDAGAGPGVPLGPAALHQEAHQHALRTGRNGTMLRRSVLGMLAAGTAIVRPASAQGDDWAKVVEAAKKEGKLVDLHRVDRLALPQDGRSRPSSRSTASRSSCWKRAPAKSASACASNSRPAGSWATSITTAARPPG